MSEVLVDVKIHCKVGSREVRGYGKVPRPHWSLYKHGMKDDIPVKFMTGIGHIMATRKNIISVQEV